MLHKYLRSRFAPGAPRRKHRGERGYASQSRACGSSRCSSPIIIPGDPPGICQLTAAAFRFQRPAMRENVLLSRRTQASKTHALQSPAPLRTAAGRQCVSAFPGQCTSNLPREQPRTETGLWAPRSGLERARLSPLGPGADTAQRGHPRTTADNPTSFPPAPGHGDPDVSPRAARTARGSPGARPHSHLRVSRSTIPHINNPSPLATTSPPFASPKLSSHLQPPLETTRCQGNEREVTTRSVWVPSRGFSSSSTSKVTWDPVKKPGPLMLDLRTPGAEPIT